METKNFKVSISIILFLMGIVTLGLSYFEKNTISLAYQLSSLLLLIISVISFYLINVIKQEKISVVLSKNQETKNEENEDMFKKNIISVDLNDDELSKDEKKVLKEIENNDNKIEQRVLTKKLFKGNKVKTFRVLSSLKEKDYIIKKKVGKINIIFLK